MTKKYCDKCRCLRTYDNNGKYYHSGSWLCEKCLKNLKVMESE